MNRSADRVIGLGPLGRAQGGEIIAEGTPEQIAGRERSSIGGHLAGVLSLSALGGLPRHTSRNGPPPATGQ